MKQTFYPLHKLNIARAWQHEKYFYKSFPFGTWLSTCMYKRRKILLKL